MGGTMEGGQEEPLGGHQLAGEYGEYPATAPIPIRKRERTFTESSVDSLDEFGVREGVRPLTLEDLELTHGYAGSHGDLTFDPTAGGRLFPETSSRRKKKSRVVKVTPRQRWRRALQLVKERGDPWQHFHLNLVPTENARRHRYCPLTSSWLVDNCLVKIASTAFAHGAMRECFRMKKLSNFSNSCEWGRDSNNFVAKQYMGSEEPRETYFKDVKLQMEAKLWAEEYNRHNPPKKVDIMMMGMVELVERAGSPLYHIEHYMGGEYIKYNSNSGFVDFAHGPERQTPQALSHFTFERSGHQLVVVDVQGVGDLYTDPQIHTASGREYGDGNLGTQGMALFFHSHRCNAICQGLGLTPFDLSTNEMSALSDSDSVSSSSATHVRLDEVLFCETPSFKERVNFSKFFREHSSASGSFGYGGTGFGEGLEVVEDDQWSTLDKKDQDSVLASSLSSQGDWGEEVTLDDCNGAQKTGRKLGRKESSVSSKESTVSSADSALGWGREPSPEVVRRARVSRPSCVAAEVLDREALGEDGVAHREESVLGMIHLDLARYHESCRFDTSVHDVASGLFHLRAAADCGNMQALVAICQIFTGRPNDILPGISQEDLKEHEKGSIEDIGVDYVVTAARMGDTASMVYLAEAFDSGYNLGTDRGQSCTQAVEWYTTAARAGTDRACCLLARAAELLAREDSGCMDLRRAAEVYEEAAEAAMEEMKGKLATKYYAKAEELYELLD